MNEEIKELRSFLRQKFTRAQWAHAVELMEELSSKELLTFQKICNRLLHSVRKVRRTRRPFCARTDCKKHVVT